MIYHDISEYGTMKMENEDIGRHKNIHPVAKVRVKALVFVAFQCCGDRKSDGAQLYQSKQFKLICSDI